MRFVRRWFFPLVLVFFVVAIYAISPADLGLIQVEVGAMVEKKKSADQVMSGVHLVETTEEGKEWELWAETAINFSGRGSWDVEKVRVVFFGDGGTEFYVRGDRGTLKVESKDMYIEGNVVTTTSNDYKAYTDSIRYNSHLRELRTPDPVEILGPKDENGNHIKLDGIGMLAELQKSKIYLQKEVRGEKALGPDKVLRIKSQKAAMTGVSKKADFIGDVEMVVDTLTIKAPKATFHYGSEESVLDRVEMRGGVRVSDLNKWATSEDLDILIPQDMFIFRGEPRVVQNNDEILGKEIVFLNGGKQIQVKAGEAIMSEKGDEI